MCIAEERFSRPELFVEIFLVGRPNLHYHKIYMFSIHRPLRLLMHFRRRS